VIAMVRCRQGHTRWKVSEKVSTAYPNSKMTGQIREMSPSKTSERGDGPLRQRCPVKTSGLVFNTIHTYHSAHCFYGISPPDRVFGSSLPHGQT
jgi:hypothetical protein